MQLYVPLYISNYCVNRCLYCGFRAAGGGRKVRLTVDELVCESEILADAGFRHLLLVSGEDPRHVTVDYLAQAVDQLRGRFASIVLETPPFDTEAYRRLARAGVDGMTLYQETYDRETYAQVHPPGRKSDYGRRLVVHDDAAAAGIPKVNLGALLGLAPWPFEALALGLHVHYLYRRYWRTFVSVSFPRIRRAGSVHFTPAHSADDADLAHMIVALRLAFPDLGLVLSTREPEAIRNRLCFLGITQMSAGSRTSPLGYSRPEVADGQFEVSDERTPAEVAAFLEQHGFDPVWKDWDASIAR
jgi:2-iminoacetate synthase